ncbi:hypothetical protein [Iningainema tapete]|uniref:Uncharacterized protein n=1 Tax=Iningainema tapete BLCC-T55 TaxID=2748662 RepID=A0A8J6XI62_9CYAN|nr:hypothetical protein [Iningainema tapete]MBD2773187.1 hypothetical protein [Iningainema tapete BLCC-T55]
MNDSDPITSAIATLIMCIGLAILLPFLVKVSPGFQLRIELDVSGNHGIESYSR